MRSYSLPAAELRGQHPLDEILAQGQIIEPALLLQGQQRASLDRLARSSLLQS